jgi:hypothetical protein
MILVIDCNPENKRADIKLRKLTAQDAYVGELLCIHTLDQTRSSEAGRAAYHLRNSWRIL